jgi:hypothetical protein
MTVLEVRRHNFLKRNGNSEVTAPDRTMPEHKPAKRSRSRWSARVTRDSDALDLESSVFKKRSPGAIARSLKRSADSSKRRKSAPFRSAMSMLNFYINRAGHNLPAARKRVLERAKDQLRRLYGRDPAGRSRGRMTAAKRARTSAARAPAKPRAD